MNSMPKILPIQPNRCLIWPSISPLKEPFNGNLGLSEDAGARPEMTVAVRAARVDLAARKDVGAQQTT